MPNQLDDSFLNRLQALRGSSAPPEAATPRLDVDLIERKRAPTREEALADRLKSLRNQDSASSGPRRTPPRASAPPPDIKRASSASPSPHVAKTQSWETKAVPFGEEDDGDSVFQTDDHTLEELLEDAEPEEPFKPVEPSHAQVTALLEELAASVPRDEVGADAQRDAGDDEKTGDSDDSDGEGMTRQVDDVLARFRDEAEIDAAYERTHPPPPGSGDDDKDSADTVLPSIEPDLLPELPTNLQHLPTAPAAGDATTGAVDDITARMAALRAPRPPQDGPSSFPAVPSSPPKNGRRVVSRLATTTRYTDEDMEGWCTVCNDDGSLRCLGCDDDVYCTRCWHEMHVGPRAGFDERSHRAVRFTRARRREKKSKVLIGAS